MLLLLLLPSLAICQNPYGPSQLDQYSRLLNSGNLGVLHQLTSTTPPPTTRATAKPTSPPTLAPIIAGIYAVNPIPEMPPMPENRIRGNFDDDGVFHPEKQIEEKQVTRNQVKVLNYLFNDFLKTHNRQTNKLILDFFKPHISNIIYITLKYDNYIPFVRQVQVPPTPDSVPRYPPFVFRPKPLPSDREETYNNLLAEVEEYDDFLDQQRAYRDRYPHAPVYNPYKELPVGQLPAAGTHSRSPTLSPQFILPRPRRQNPPLNDISSDHQSVWKIHMAHAAQDSPPQTSPSQYTPAVTEHPLLNILNILSMPHAHALAAPHISLESNGRSEETPTRNPYRLPMLPSAHPLQLVDIHQQPIVS
uniref:Extensin n=1 Tax=Heterorhabditis bacteriophora TaxID=37862 RepID=A0A1I7WY99_HETBA